MWDRNTNNNTDEICVPVIREAKFVFGQSMGASGLGRLEGKMKLTNTNTTNANTTNTNTDKQIQQAPKYGGCASCTNADYC